MTFWAIFFAFFVFYAYFVNFSKLFINPAQFQALFFVHFADCKVLFDLLYCRQTKRKTKRRASLHRVPYEAKARQAQEGSSQNVRTAGANRQYLEN